MRKFVLGFALLTAALTGHANDQASDGSTVQANNNVSTVASSQKSQAKVLSLDDLSPSEFLTLVGRMEKDIPKISSKGKRQQAQSTFDAINSKLAGVSDWSSISGQDRIELTNQYESLRAQVGTGREFHNQMRCRKVRRLGSNMISEECKSRAQTEKESFESADRVRDIQSKSLQAIPGN